MHNIIYSDQWVLIRIAGFECFETKADYTARKKRIQNRSEFRVSQKNKFFHKGEPKKYKVSQKNNGVSQKNKIIFLAHPHYFFMKQKNKNYFFGSF